MLHGKKIVVVMPAYNAAKTIRQTYEEIPKDVVDEIVLTDDASTDGTVDLARRLPLHVFRHDRNRGYGGNLKTCFSEALELNADIVVSVHPDYQYTPRLITAMAAMIALGEFDVVLGSRILGGGAIRGGMPLYKYVSNRFLTLIQNFFIGEKVSEYHTGYRAWSRKVLEAIPILENSDDFVFDNQMLVQAFFFGFRVGEISCPCRYNPDSSSINALRSLKYGLGVLVTTAQVVLQRMGLAKVRRFDPAGRRLIVDAGPA